jgi:hypothetical protein
MTRPAAPLIRRGELVPLLQDEIDSQYVPIHALMLQERHRLPKIRACIDYWAQWLGKVQATSTALSKTATGGAPSSVDERPERKQKSQPARSTEKP